MAPNVEVVTTSQNGDNLSETIKVLWKTDTTLITLWTKIILYMYKEKKKIWKSQCCFIMNK